MVAMKTFFMEQLARRNERKLTTLHIYPGYVLTDIMSNSRMPRIVRWLDYIIAPCVKRLAVDGMDCGKKILYLGSARYPARRATGSREAESMEVESRKVESREVENEVAKGTDGVKGGGAYKVSWDGEVINHTDKYGKGRDMGMAEKVWEHTMKTLEIVKAGRVFRTKS